MIFSRTQQPNLGGRYSAGRQPTVCQLLCSLGMGGAEVLAGRLAQALAGSYRFLFVCLDQAGPLGTQLHDAGFPVHVLGRRPGLDWKCVLRLVRLLRRERVDLLHAHQAPPFLYAGMARLIAHHPAVLFTEHGRDYPDFPRRKRMLANWLFLERRDRVVAVGEAVRQALVSNEGIAAERIGVVYNGRPLQQFAPDPDARLPVREELGLGPADFVILQVARLDPLKDHATAIRAFKLVAERRPDARLVLVGDGPLLGALQDLVGRLHLAPFVRFLGVRHDVSRLLAAGDVLLLTSVTEGIPLVFIEGMAAELPVVSTDVGGVPEVVLGGSTGLLAPSGEDARLAEHLLTLAADPVRRKQMGQRGRERALALFSETEMHAAYRRIYAEMLGSRPGYFRQPAGRGISSVRDGSPWDRRPANRHRA